MSGCQPTILLTFTEVATLARPGLLNVLVGNLAERLKDGGLKDQPSGDIFA